MSELEQLRQEAEQLKNQIRVCFIEVFSTLVCRGLLFLTAKTGFQTPFINMQMFTESPTNNVPQHS